MGVCVVAVLALVVAGCGGGRLTKSQYEDKLQGAGNDLSGAVQQLTQAATKDEFKDDVGDVQNALDSAADTLDGVTPPRDVASANDRLVHGLRGLADDFGRLKDAADQGIDAATLRARQVTTGAASRETRQAIEELRRHGYDVGRLGT
jgi:division protein CdvB (Snf7/Vps24/ESCRT-III family)